MILSGPNDCRGSTKDARILPVFLHSPAQHVSISNSISFRVSVSQRSDVTAAGRRRSLIQVSATQPIAVRDSDLLLMDEGSGLLRLKPMFETSIVWGERVFGGEKVRDE